jgi:adenine-specific DNA-methyltransferase
MNALAQKSLLSVKNKENGVVYTPPELAYYVAQKVVSLIVKDIKSLNLSDSDITKKLQGLKIIDPACGEGELLTAAWNALRTEGIASHIVANEVLYGIDLDSQSVKKTSKNIQKLGVSHKNSNLLVTNALSPSNVKTAETGSEYILNKFRCKQGFDILIANPPWGASTVSYDRELSESNFTLNKGQFDTSDLFVELATALVKKDGYFAFIIPDSIFGVGHKEMRKMLVERTEIKFIGRMGEKIFEGVNRACVVLICKNTMPKSNNKVKCMRLNPLLRKDILKGEKTYFEVDKLLSHKVKQSRFAKNKNLLFDIDTKESEMRIIDKITKSGKSVGEYLSSSRGVELSKTGKVCRCAGCGFWMPVPNTNMAKCSHCSSSVDLSYAETTRIISKTWFKGSKPILVGESVRRYSISSRYWISVNNEGINYKNISLYYEPKILVRKTGVGITATIDYSNALTNQVVYMFRSRVDQTSPVPIEFILAVMNSRAIYYYLLKNYGETEWRSHPYLTQSQVASLPLPNLDKSSAIISQKKIVAMLKPYLEKDQQIPKSIDASVEALVASMFELSRTDYEILYKTLNSTQGLVPVKELTGVHISDIFK